MDNNIINHAIKVWHLGQYRKARSLLLPILSENPEHPVINGLLGSINYEDHRFKAAYRHFAITNRESPKSETALLGMLHSALKLRWQHRALEAAEKLVMLTNDKLYIQVVKEIRSGA